MGELHHTRKLKTNFSMLSVQLFVSHSHKSMTNADQIFRYSWFNANALVPQPLEITKFAVFASDLLFAVDTIDGKFSYVIGIVCQDRIISGLSILDIERYSPDFGTKPCD